MFESEVEAAITSSDESALIDLVTGNPVDAKSFHHPTYSDLLNFASLKSLLRLCRTLIAIGMDVNIVNYNLDTPLISACSAGNADIVDYLLANGADPNYGRTLISAINCRQPTSGQIVKSLCRAGVDVNRVFLMFDDPENRRTAFDFAARKNELAEILIKHGALPASKCFNSPAYGSNNEIVN